MFLPCSQVDNNAECATIAFDNKIFFQAEEGTNGLELWKSDGTADGTVMVKDIRDGSTDSRPVRVSYICTPSPPPRSRVHPSPRPSPAPSSPRPCLRPGRAPPSLPALTRTLRSPAPVPALTRTLRSPPPCAHRVAPAQEKFVIFGNELFFSAYDGTNRGLWKASPQGEICTFSCRRCRCRCSTLNGPLSSLPSADRWHGRRHDLREGCRVYGTAGRLRRQALLRGGW